MASPIDLTEPGRFALGCNYWASHAGANMWRDWREDVVREDLRRIADSGLQVLRVFPTWRDFQPIEILRGFRGGMIETRIDGRPLPDDDLGRAGLSPTAVERLATFADLAEQHGLKLLVSLVTGWMSGRLFAPPALAERNVLTDPLAILWQVRMARALVRRFRSHPAVVAWELGNECDCMGTATREEAWVWAATISQAVRVEDPDRPVLSGMHGLTPQAGGPWRIQDQAELTDALTTHPYPLFTPHCGNDPINTFAPCLHATAESRLYADVGGRPCLVEEIGTLGPNVCDDATAADFVRTALLSTWAHGCTGLLWWCAFDATGVDGAPYDREALERELGLFRADRAPKPTAAELSAFGAFLCELPVESLPAFRTDAVCILTEGQDAWPTAFGSFLLAKQAGFDVEFQHAHQTLRPSDLYLLPCLSGKNAPRPLWVELLDRVRDGATLYVSVHDGMVSPLREALGADVVTRERRRAPAEVTLDFAPHAPRMTVGGPLRLNLAATSAKVLAREQDGNPVLTRNRLGKGSVYFLSLPMETDAATSGGAFHGPSARPCREVYRLVADSVLEARAVRKRLPHVGLTEHTIGARHRVIVAINYSPEPVREQLHVSLAWEFEACWRGAPPVVEGNSLTVELPANDGAVLLLASSEGERVDS